MNSLDQTKEIFEIDQTPLKTVFFKNRLIIRDSIVIITNNKSNKIAGFILKIIVYAFWGSVVYNLYNLNFILFDEAPLLASILLTLLLYVTGIVITFFSLIINLGSKNKEYINKKTNKISLLSLNGIPNFSIDDITGLQLIGYISEKKIPNPKGYSSATETITNYEINLISKDKKRYGVISFTQRQKALDTLKKLSTFLEKPYYINITDTDEQYNSKRREKIIKSGLTVKANLSVKKSYLEKLKETTPFKITQINTNQLSITCEDNSLEDIINIKIGTIKCYLDISDSSNSQHKNIKIETAYRYDSLAFILFTIAIFIFGFDKQESISNIFYGILPAIFLYRIILLRLAELKFIDSIVESLENDVEDLN